MAYTPNTMLVERFWTAYLSGGGSDNRKAFDHNLQKFFDLTFDAFITGDAKVTRQEAMQNFVRYVGSTVNARRYFTAVDSVDSYT